MLRQQVLIIGRKKDQFAENLKDLRGEHNSLDKQLKEKRKHLGDDGEILRGEDVRAFFKLFLLNNALFLVEFTISHSPAEFSSRALVVAAIDWSQTARNTK